MPSRNAIALAAIRIAIDMVKERLIDDKEALARIEPDALNELLRPVFDLKEKELAVKNGRLLAKGLNAGPAPLQAVLLDRSRCRRMESKRRIGHPLPHGDITEDSRHGCFPRYPHGIRRYDLARYALHVKWVRSVSSAAQFCRSITNHA